ncbi:hypothetical protein [Streptomyces sp. NPDC058086]|uniref:hypothetical protein n=1 Tax=Streptomyces sp. NPDC058086 TaxID=3346334 RepID=UPI0036E064C8
MNELERLGVVGPDQGSRARDVLIRLVEDMEPVFNALMHGETISMRTAVEAALAEQTDETLVLPMPREFPSFTVTKAPTTPEAPADDPDEDGESEPEHSRSVEGTVYTAQEWEVSEDPEGDRPWINPQLRTREGRRGYLRFKRRQMRRRARKTWSRQGTAHGVLPRCAARSECGPGRSASREPRRRRT